MKAFLCAIILCFLLTGVVMAADAPNKISLDAKALAIKDATAQVSKLAGVSIVLDPKATGSVTASMNNAGLDQVLDVITKSNNLTWKKLQFARKEDSKVSLDQLKSGILALASMQLVGLSVEDPATKTGAVFAKDLPAAADTSKLGLPEGYSWSTVYVILAPEPVAEKPAEKDKVAELSKAQADALYQVANMTTEERAQYYQNQWMAQIKLAPEARQAMFRDQMQAMTNLDPQYRDQLMQDMRTVFGGMRGLGGGQRGQRQHGNQGQQEN